MEANWASRYGTKSSLLNEFEGQQIDGGTTVGHSVDRGTLKCGTDFNGRNRGILGIRFGFIGRAAINYLINRLLFNLACLLLAFMDCIVDPGVTLVLLFVRAIPPSMVDINPATICTAIVGLEDFAILVCEFGGEFELTSATGAGIVQRGGWSGSTRIGGKTGRFIRSIGFIESHARCCKCAVGFLSNFNDLV